LSPQVEHYRLDYAMSLMPYRATWRLATQYLAWCPSHGAAALKLLLDRLPIAVPGGDTQLAQKVHKIRRAFLSISHVFKHCQLSYRVCPSAVTMLCNGLPSLLHLVSFKMCLP
jgi:nuclear pore complex protein Nup85